MIINTSQGDIEVIGDVKEFKTSIDPKNLEFITTLLSSNLYSDPEQSFIREIVSNAWDSHVEADTTDVPVIVRFSKENYLHNVTIRDYGVGLSPERFDTVFRSIGSSTKRESNAFIGAFGIGHLSPFACSNTVYITSYYNGMAYYYIGSKSNNTITYHRLMEKPTSEKNGVKVTIKGITNIKPYYKALDYITFFPNVYVDGAENANKINGAKIKRFKNFAASSIVTESKLLLGNVLYLVNFGLLSQASRDFLMRIGNTGIVIMFEVGEISITPNRENIIYNSETIKRIDKRIADARDELLEMIGAKLTQDYTDILKYYELMSYAKYYNPITDSLEDFNYQVWGYRIEPKSLFNTKITFLGYDLRKYINQLSAIMCLEVPNYRGVVYKDRIYSKKLPYKVARYNNIKSQGILILNHGTRLAKAAKMYIKENYNECCIMTEIDYPGFAKWIKDKLGSTLNENPVMIEVMIKGIYDSLISRAKTLDLTTDKKYLDFKANMSKNKPVIPVKEAIIYVWNNRGWRERLRFERLSEALDYIKSQKKGIILGNMEGDTALMRRLAELKNYTFIQARKDIVSDIRNLNPSYLVNTDWLTKSDPLIAAVKATLLHFPDNVIDSQVVKEICNNLTREEGDELLRIVRLRNIFGDDYYYKGLVNRANVKCDPYTDYICLKLKNYLTKHNEVKDLVHQSNLNSDILTTAAVIKTKAYLVSHIAYKRVQNNKLLRVLCKK